METKWTGNVRDLVNRVASSDARETFIDAKSGAKIRINIDGVDEDEAYGKAEPFYIESPDGDNLYDAYDRKEAVMILSNIRRGEKYPDMPSAAPKRKRVAKQKPRRKSHKQTSSGMMGMR